MTFGLGFLSGFDPIVKLGQGQVVNHIINGGHERGTTRHGGDVRLNCKNFKRSSTEHVLSCHMRLNSCFLYSSFDNFKICLPYEFYI